MNARAELLLPPPSLASCVAVGVFRDTLAADLPDQDRMNFFPASPIFAVTRVFEGQLHSAAHITDIATLRRAPAMPSVWVEAPHDTPICSWSPAGMRALTIGFFPDAWVALGGSSAASAIPHGVQAAFMGEFDDLASYWDTLCAGLTPLWEDARPDDLARFRWGGSNRMTDWVLHVTTAAAMIGPGRSLRSTERRLRRWTGQTRQSLEFFARIEDLHERSLVNSGVPLAQIAAEADYSDQSHMGRAVKRATGFTPAQINRLIETEEPFWCYRLLGERF